MTVFRLSVPLKALPLALLLTACGGGTTADAPAASANLTGTVPGTIIQAFCSDGSNPSVSSEQNGTAEHPFSLALPAQTDCRIVMVTNEGTAEQIITPLTFNGNAVINMNVNFSLGYVPLAMDPNNIVDANGDGVVDEPLDLPVTVEEGVVVHTLNYDPMDTDSDGIPNYYDDDDNDGVANYEDDDYEHDGDSDRDGIDDEYDNDDDNDGVAETDSTTATEPTATDYQVVSGRLLAAQCFQCHGSGGHSVNGWDSIAGESYGEILEEMNEYATTHIMGAQSVGYSQAEREALASYLAGLSESSNSSGDNYDSESDEDYDDEHDDDNDEHDDD